MDMHEKYYEEKYLAEEAARQASLQKLKQKFDQMQEVDKLNVLKKFNITHRDGNKLQEDELILLLDKDELIRREDELIRREDESKLFNVPHQDNYSEEDFAVLNTICNNGIYPCFVFDVPDESSTEEAINKFKKGINKFISRLPERTSIRIRYCDEIFYTGNSYGKGCIQEIYRYINLIYKSSKQQIKELHQDVDTEIGAFSSTKIKTKIPENHLRLLLINPELLSGHEKYKITSYGLECCINFKNDIYKNYQFFDFRKITEVLHTELSFDLGALQSEQTNINGMIRNISNQCPFMKITIRGNIGSKTFEIYSKKFYGDLGKYSKDETALVSYEQYITNTLTAIKDFIDGKEDQPGTQPKIPNEEEPRQPTEKIEGKTNGSDKNTEQQNSQKKLILTWLELFMMVIILILLCLVLYFYKQTQGQVNKKN